MYDYVSSGLDFRDTRRHKIVNSVTYKKSASCMFTFLRTCYGYVYVINHIVTKGQRERERDVYYNRGLCIKHFDSNICCLHLCVINHITCKMERCLL